MAIIKKNDVTPERPVIIVLYGTPGSGKTSLATTAENPILIDTDRGYDRAVQRIDTLVASSWQEITAEYATMQQYKTIIVDTAKACLDDFLAAYVISLDSKLSYNTLKRFGRMADEFKLFVNTIRSYGADLVFICHDKEMQDGDTIKHSPDCTGQSKDLLVRIADQVGYVYINNGKRSISFEPYDTFVGKNVAQLKQMAIPESGTEEYKTCMAKIISDVRTSIRSKSEAQRLADETLTALRDDLGRAENPEDFDACLEARTQLPAALQKPYAGEVNKKATEKGYKYDAKAKKYVKAA